MALTSEPKLRRTLVHLVAVPAWAGLGAVAVPFVLGIAVPPSVRYLPFLGSLVLFGVPHGAADHLAVARLGGARPLTAVGVVYLVGGAVCLATWIIAPAVAFAGFVLLTWYHWGQGDVYFLLAVGADHLRSRSHRLLALVVRGGIPMVVPLVAFPDVYRSVTVATVSLFDPGAAASLAFAFRPRFRLAAGCVLVVLSIVSLTLTPALAGTNSYDVGWWIDALETALLWGYFLVVPPVLAVGLYFCLWHSVRHVVRLVVVDESGPSLGWATVGSGLARFCRDALPNTVGAFVLLGALALALPPDATLRSSLGLYLVGLALLTLPHSAVVTWMDLREGVWSAV